MFKPGDIVTFSKSYMTEYGALMNGNGEQPLGIVHNITPESIFDEPMYRVRWIRSHRLAGRSFGGFTTEDLLKVD